MRELLVPCLCFFCFEAFSADIWEPNGFYCGDPCSRDLRTYVNLCRKTKGSEDKCYNPDRFDGLSVAFITTDGEFCGFDPEKDKNIVWSASACLGGKGFEIKYVYNYERYKNSGEEIIDYGNDITGLPDSDEYLHNLDGSPCVSKTVSNCYAEGSELRVVATLRTALFRWEIPGKKLSDILKLMGKVGERREIKNRSVNAIPEYRLSGPDSFFDLLRGKRWEWDQRSHNCATFSAEIISKIVGIATGRGEVGASLILPAVGCLEFAAVLAAAFFLPGGPIVTALYTVAGGSASISIVQGLSLAKYNAYLNTPNGVINILLGFYNNAPVFIDSVRNDRVFRDNLLNILRARYNTMTEDELMDIVREYEERYGRTYEGTNTAFKIVAHDFEESRDHCRNKRIDSYKNFELKSAKEAVVSKLKMGKQKGSRKEAKETERKLLNNIFLKSDFNETGNRCVIM